MRLYECKTCGWHGKRPTVEITYEPHSVELSCPNCNRSVVRDPGQERAHLAMGFVLLCLAAGLITLMYFGILGTIGNLIAAFLVFGLFMGSAMFLTAEDGRMVHYRQETTTLNRDGTVAKKIISYT